MLTETNTVVPSILSTNRTRRSCAWLRRRLAAGMVAVASLAAAGLSAAAPASALVISTKGLGCRIDCIGAVTAQPHAYGADFTVATSVPTTLQVLIDTDATWGGAFTGGSSSTFKTSHTVHVDGLQPSTGYYFHVRATDKNGNVRIESGRTLHTRTRKLTVTVEKVKVVDDSDDLGAGEMWLHAWVAGTGGYLRVFSNLAQDQDWSSGSTYYVNKKFTVENPPPGARVDVQLADDDGCTPQASFDKKSSGCYDSGVASMHPTIDASVLSAYETRTVVGHGGVEFEVTLHYTLTLS